jgi:hypothetical protein
MKIDLQIRIQDEKIIVDSPQKNHHQEYKNLLGMANGRVVSIGQSLDDLIKENPQNEDKFREEVKFEPIYIPSSNDLDNLQFFLEYQVVQLRNMDAAGARLVSRLINSNSILYSLDLPNYENIKESVRHQFEFSLTKYVVHELRINQVSAGWEKWQRRVLEASRPILLLAWPILWYFFVLWISQYISSTGFMIWFVYIAAFFAIYYLVVLLRVLILKKILPRDLIRSELLSPRVGHGKFGVFVAHKFFDNQ